MYFRDMTNSNDCGDRNVSVERDRCPYSTMSIRCFKNIATAESEGSTQPFSMDTMYSRPLQKQHYYFRFKAVTKKISVDGGPPAHVNPNLNPSRTPHDSGPAELEAQALSLPVTRTVTSQPRLGVGHVNFFCILYFKF